jgi:mRNA interferase MazF
MILKINSGELWLANLNPRNGTEPGKTRPVLVIQDQALLDGNHPSVIIIPLTTNLVDNTEPLRIRMAAHDRLKQESDLLIDQIRSIDIKRLTQGPIALCEKKFMNRVYKAIAEVIGISQLS